MLLKDMIVLLPKNRTKNQHAGKATSKASLSLFFDAATIDTAPTVSTSELTVGKALLPGVSFPYS